MADGTEEGFTLFFEDAEPRLRRALIATYGAERGREAAAEALAYAWQHWERVHALDNPVGYLYRVGQTRSRPGREPEAFPPVPVAEGLWVEPDLPAALADLTERERLAVVLIEGFGWKFREVAALADVSVSSIQSYLDRGMRKLRSALVVPRESPWCVSPASDADDCVPIRPGRAPASDPHRSLSSTPLTRRYITVTSARHH